MCGRWGPAEGHGAFQPHGEAGRCVPVLVWMSQSRSSWQSLSKAINNNSVTFAGNFHVVDTMLEPYTQRSVSSLNSEPPSLALTFLLVLTKA